MVRSGFLNRAAPDKKILMAQQLKTLLNRTYEVQAPETCTVTNSDGNTILTAYAGVPVQFTADGKEVILSADSAMLRLVEGKSVVSVTGSGEGGASASGETVKALSSPSLVMKHAVWYDNNSYSDITVQPAAWRNEVMTCTLKTPRPVSLAGVNWLYGQPTMVEGYTYVIAMQQIDATTILANLAYILPQ